MVSDVKNSKVFVYVVGVIVILVPSPWFLMPPPLSLVVCWLPSIGDCRDVDEEGDRYRGEREVNEDVGDI